MRLLAFLLFASLAQAQTATVTLNFTASTGSVSKYNVYRSTTSGQYATSLGSTAALKYADPIPLTASPQTFFYVVRAVAADGKTESVNSNEAKASLPAIPLVPTKLTCSVTITGATVTGTCQ